MKIKHHLNSITAGLVVFISVMLLYGTEEQNVSARSANAQAVHALLIILGNDPKIRVTVEVNERQLVQMFRELSHDCPVHLTIMKSESPLTGTITKQSFVDGTGGTPDIARQDIIRSEQVAEWLQALKPKAEDTVLIYYSGHGEIKAFDTHVLIFDEANGDIPDRQRLSEALARKPARLRMLITDTCSTLSQDLPATVFKTLAIGIRARARQYHPSDLFLKHEGFLDITAASSGQLALGHESVGGHFTSALLSHGFTALADIGKKDGFISWEEAFAASAARTEALFEAAREDNTAFALQAALKKHRQQTQTPKKHSLPQPLGDTGSSVPVQPPPRQGAILNFTSVPSGAKVSIDGYVVGKTPLENYELETDGQSTKEIEVSVQAAGYVSEVEQFRVRSGQAFDWKFPLTQKEKALPNTITGQDGAEMVLIPAGEFQMGSNNGDDDETPVHTVYVDAFYMDKYEVTNAQYQKFVLANPLWQKARIPKSLHDGRYLSHWNGNNYPAGKANHPVVYVTWYAAVAYSKWVGKRLPTEAEWEKAARGGLSGRKYPWGNTISEANANYNTHVGDTTVIGSYPANAYGLHDMSGNVWEWCLDAYNRNFYFSSPGANPLSDVNILSNVNLILDDYTNVKSMRVLRGGSWSTFAQYVRCACRSRYPPTNTSTILGFRCARAVSP